MSQFFPQRHAVVTAEEIENASIALINDIKRLSDVNGSTATDEPGQKFNQQVSAEAESLVQQTYQNAATPTHRFQPS